jgi:site-specific recombinase XerD
MRKGQMETIQSLHHRFVRERTYLDNVTPKTVVFYNQAFRAFGRAVPSALTMSPGELTPDVLNDFIFTLRERGTARVVSINTYISGLNSFLSWLHQRQFTPSKLRLPKLKVGRSLPKTIDSGRVTRLIGFKPRSFRERRVHAVVLTVLDTGLRITEVLTVSPDAIDLDNLIMRVIGKGRRERVVPFSEVLRRVLVRWSHALVDAGIQSSRFAFPNRFGECMGYRNLLRDYGLMCNALGIVRPGGFHRLRHTFATDYLGNGGNTRYLQNILGHASIRSTEIYTHPDEESIRVAHSRYGPLAARLTGRSVRT